MLLMDIETFCADSASVWQVIGYVFSAFKIIIPILIIVMGSIDLGKAVMSGKDEDIKNNAKSLAWRFVAAVLIFLLPSIVGMIFNWVMDFSGSEVDYKACTTCVTSPSRCDTSAAVTVNSN